MNLKFPSANQLRYAQSVFPSETSGVSRPLPPDVINKILIEADDETFYDLCASPEFTSFCSANSAYSEAIYEERARKRVQKRYSQDLIQFKPGPVLGPSGEVLKPAMKWREFDIRMQNLIRSMPYVNDLATEGKLMELKIMKAITGQIPDIEGANGAASNGHLATLKWIYEQSSLNGTYILPSIFGANWTAERGHLDVLKWIYEQSGLLPDITGVDWAAYFGRLDILKWIYEQSGLLPDIRGVNWAAIGGYLETLKWIYETSSNAGQPILPEIEEANYVARSGRLDILKWLYEKNPNIVPNSEGANWAAQYGRQNVLDWLATKGVFPTDS